MLSYTNLRLGVPGRIAEALLLLKKHAAAMPDQVRRHIGGMDHSRATIEQALGQPLVGRRILEIGPGQQLRQARYYAASNSVTAVDLDEIIVGANPLGLWRALRANGPVRFFKTLARKVLGFDRCFVAELARQLPASRSARPRVLRCDAARTGLASESFDCSVSTSVFEHLPDPAAVMQEIARLLRPGGVAHHVIHVYTSDSGAHDARTFTADRRGLPYWCHLRTNHAHLSASNCYVNKLTIAQWLATIRSNWPGASVQHFKANDAPTLQALAVARSRGELTAYSDGELLTLCLEVTWVRPIESAAIAA